MHRNAPAILVFFVAFAALAGCRQSAVSKHGIESTIYDRQEYVLIEDDERGGFLAVVPSSADIGPFMVTASNGMIWRATELGRRTLEVVPLTPGSPNSDTLFTTPPTFHDTLEDAGEEVGTYGVTSAGTITWFGDAPDGPRSVAVVDTVRLTAGELDFVTNVGTWDADSAAWFGEDPIDGRLVISQGAPLSERPTLARLGQGARRVAPKWTTLVEGELPPDDAHLFQERAAPLARRAGGDLYVTIWNNRVYIGSTESISVRGVPYILGSHPLGVGGTAGEVGTEIRAFVAMARRQPLAAAGFFDPADLDIHGNSEFAQVGLLELFAQAGYYPFAKARLLETGPIQGARRLTHARLLHRAGSKQARAEGAKAYEELLDAQGLDGAGARGAAATLVAQIDAHDGNWKTSAAVAEQAAQSFKDMNDAIRAAQAELFAGEAALISGDTERGTKLANQARSRFYHGKAPYQSAMTEVSLAHLFLRAGDSDEAAKMADYAARRFASTGDEIARNRALIALGRVRADANAIEAGLTRSVELGDSVGALDAAAALVELSGVPQGDTAAEWLGLVAHGFPLVTEPMMLLRASNAASALCEATGGSVGAETLATQEYVALLCDTDLDLEAPRATASASQIISRLELGQYASASRNLDRLDPANETVEQAVATALTRRLARGEAAASVHGGSLDAFRALDQNRRWEALLDASSTAERVGAHDLSIMWMSDAIEAVKAAENLPSAVETRAFLARDHVAQLVRFERPLQASNAAEEALVGMAAVSNTEKVAMASVAGFGAVAASMVSATDDVASARGRVDDAAEGLSAAETADLRSQLAWFAARHGVATLAREDLQAARAAQSEVPAERRSATVIARIAVADAFLLLRDGDRNKAFKAVSIWFDNPGAELEVASDLWTLTLTAAPSDELREGFRDRLRSASPELMPAARGVLAQKAIEMGRLDDARKILDGGDIGANPTAPLMLRLVSRTIDDPASTSVQTDRLSETTRLVLIGILARTQHADEPRTAVSEWAQKRVNVRGTGPIAEARLRLVTDIATVKPTSQPKTKGLQDDVETALGTRDADVIVPTVVERVEDLIETGRPEAARTVLDRTETWFGKASKESSGELARLRLAADVVALRPVAAFERSNSILRGPTVEPAESRARVHLLIARNDFLLGLDGRAAAQLRSAHTAARSANAQTLIKEIESLATSFDIQLDR